MRNFTFSLQSLLLLRSHIREQAFQEWVRAMQELQKAVLDSQRAHARLESWLEVQREQQTKAVSVQELRRSYEAAYEFYRQWMEREQRRQAIENLVRQTQVRWQEAQKNEEVLERLKHRAWTEWTQKKEKEEQKLSDERASILSFRRMRNPLDRLAGGGDLHLL